MTQYTAEPTWNPDPPAIRDRMHKEWAIDEVENEIGGYLKICRHLSEKALAKLNSYSLNTDDTACIDAAIHSVEVALDELGILENKS